MDRKTIIAISATAAIGLMVTLVWNLISKGTEATIADNPAIVNIQIQADKANDIMTSHLIAVEGRLAGIEGKQGRIIDNQNLILDKLTQ